MFLFYLFYFFGSFIDLFVCFLFVFSLSHLFWGLYGCILPLEVTMHHSHRSHNDLFLVDCQGVVCGSNTGNL
ncbi:hypothetical protein BDV26DRAFT_257144 [Aspergillus bertholletiae]|uniref:Uncharacterized protein n=1 Tax=Aspergillus bertholletiae TaxID=1226010 RepID=A0A5N7BFE9_9EURO|nr:hypothetical protein BDV26DRAFT_257144 [Aspergillus bertholletiae]